MVFLLTAESPQSPLYGTLEFLLVGGSREIRLGKLDGWPYMQLSLDTKEEIQAMNRARAINCAPHDGD